MPSVAFDMTGLFRRASILALACSALAAPQEDLRRDAVPFKQLERDFASPAPQKRRVAIARLALLDTRAAWGLVLEGLRDKEPEVADAAQIALGAVRDPKLIGELCARAGLAADDTWVRPRVAEAFGRMSCEIDAQALLRAMDPNQVELSRTILWSVERLARAKRLGGDREKCVDALTKLARGSGAANLRAAALVALAAIDRFAADPLVQVALDSPDCPVRCAALRVVQSASEQECMTLSVPLLADPEPAVRIQAVENLERFASRASMLALIERMEVEPRERLRWRILGHLRAASGLSHGFDARAWTRWAETVSGRTVTGVHAGASRPMGETSACFAGMTLISDRLCFLVDLSGSVWQRQPSGKTRKEIIDEKLAVALEALPEGTEFNVIPYTGQPIPWEKKLAASTRSNVKRALAFFERCHASGRGNFYDAVQLALADPRVDTIMVLTDGLPTGGRRWNLELMVELLVEQNRYRKVAFDSILVDAPPRLAKHWVDLAERTGGRSTEVALE